MSSMDFNSNRLDWNSFKIPATTKKLHRVIHSVYTVKCLCPHSKHSIQLVSEHAEPTSDTTVARLMSRHTSSLTVFGTSNVTNYGMSER